MKKYAILTSILALAACGGGSGGGGVSDSGMRVSNAAIKSNAAVTSMASEILIAKDGTSPNIVRSASVVNNGKNYIAYHLDDAKFFETNMESDDEYISFGIDENTGQIDEITYNMDGMVDSIGRDGPQSSIFTQNVYKYKVELDGNTYYTDSLPVVKGGYSKDQIKAAFEDAHKGEISDETLTKILSAVDSTDMIPTEYVHHHVVDLQGKKLPESDKLRYSDFGFTTILAKEVHEEGDGDGDDNSVIFGGYEVKEIKNTENLRGLEFSGKAIAALGNVHENGVKKIETDNNAATLSIDNNGKQTLIMPFKDYYTISVAGPEQITWTGNTNIGYELNDKSPVQNQQVNMKYYGDNSIPSEVVGGVFFQNNDVEFNGAFGVTKK